jgi:hypothetical protein
MKVLTDILTILNLCTVQFFGIFDSNTSLYQSSVPAVIVSKEIRNISQKTREILKSIQPASLSQKCLKSGTGIVAFISVNELLTTNVSGDPIKNEFIMLDRYKPLLEQASVYSNPAFVLLQVNTIRFSQHNLIFDWMKLPITSQLLLFNAGAVYCPTIDPGPSLRIIFDTCMISQTETSPLNAIKALWKNTCEKLNLNNRFIHLTAGLPTRRKIYDCSLNLDRLRTNPVVCIIHILENQINFTTTRPPQNPPYFILKLLKTIVTKTGNDVIISKRHPGFQWLTHGVKFESYKLILITKLQRVNVDSLLEPFDRNMWMALILANCLFFIVGCLGLKFKKNRKLILWMISTILSQTDEMLTKYLFDKKRLINLALVCSWFFLMFLLNVLYQGDLYSCLSNVRLPSLPNSLRETLATNIPLFTMGTSCNSTNKKAKNRQCSSTLLTQIIPDILKSKETQANLTKLANKVLNRTETIFGNPLLIALDMAINSDKSRTNKNAQITPNTFGILASSNNIDEFNTAARIYFKEHIVRQTNDINPFISMTPWITQRGLFATAFSSGVGRLTQSGLVERWTTHNRKWFVMRVSKTKFKSMHDLENKLQYELTDEEVASRLASGVYKWEGSGRLYSKFMLVPDTNLRLASAQSVPFEVMKLPFLACLVLNSLSLVVFFIERVATNVRRWMVKQSTVKEV